MDEGYPVEIPKGYSKEESIEIMELMVEEYSKNLKEKRYLFQIDYLSCFCRFFRCIKNFHYNQIILQG